MFYMRYLIEVGKVPSSMKLPNVASVYKKDSRSDKGFYRSISILPNLSKVFERCVYRQTSNFSDEILSKY